MSLENKKILIIDDDSRNIFALKLVLKTKGFFSLSSTDINEAFDLLKSEKNVKVILMDMMMPGIDGYQAIEIIKKNEELKDIPVIAVTAQAMAGDKEKCLNAGADGYVSKPINIDHLLDVIIKYV